MADVLGEYYVDHTMQGKACFITGWVNKEWGGLERMMGISKYMFFIEMSKYDGFSAKPIKTKYTGKFNLNYYLKKI